MSYQNGKKILPERYWRLSSSMWMEPMFIFPAGKSNDMPEKMTMRTGSSCCAVIRRFLSHQGGTIGAGTHTMLFFIR